MSSHVESTVIGSYPVTIQPLDVMKAYEHRTMPSWKPCIHQAVSQMIDAGIDMVSDGQTRDPFIHIFARGLEGCRIRKRPEIIGPIDLTTSITYDDLTYVRQIIPKEKKVLGLIVGPCTLSESVQDFYYHDKQEAACAFAQALKKEITKILPIVDMISIDEPFFSNQLPRYAKDLIGLLTKNVTCPTRLHVCGNVGAIVPDLVDFPVDVLSHEFKATPHLFDVFEEYSSKKQICLGCVRSDDTRVESVEEIISHIQQATAVFDSNLYQIAPDCGLRMLPASTAFEKLKNISIAKRKMYG